MNKDKHDHQCHKQWKYVSPFILSVGGILGKEAQVVIDTLNKLVATKTQERISKV